MKAKYFFESIKLVSFINQYKIFKNLIRTQVPEHSAYPVFGGSVIVSNGVDGDLLAEVSKDNNGGCSPSVCRWEPGQHNQDLLGKSPAYGSS